MKRRAVLAGLVVLAAFGGSVVLVDEPTDGPDEPDNDTEPDTPEPSDPPTPDEPDDNETEPPETEPPDTPPPETPNGTETPTDPGTIDVGDSESSAGTNVTGQSNTGGS